MDLSDLWRSAPSQLFRAMSETCARFRAPGMLVLFGIPDTLHPAYMSALYAALPDTCMVAN
eukprot:11358223-Alexandrium_andersonii.AAC.1